MDSNSYYNQYKSINNDQLLYRYETLVFKLKDSPSVEGSIELGAVLKLTQERKLSIVAHLQKKAAIKGKAERKEKVGDLLKDYRKTGYKFLFYGLLSFVAGASLTAGTGGKAFFYGALVIGILYLIAGIFFMVSSLGFSTFAWWKERSMRKTYKQ